jgi:selenide,water dikinase
MLFCLPLQVDAVSSFAHAARTYDMACDSMDMLNLTGATLMHKYKSVGATDVTGFGLLGHAS